MKIRRPMAKFEGRECAVVVIDFGLGIVLLDYCWNVLEREMIEDELRYTEVEMEDKRLEFFYPEPSGV